MEWIFIICKTRSRKLQQQLASISQDIDSFSHIYATGSCSRNLQQKVASESCFRIL